MSVNIIKMMTLTIVLDVHQDLIMDVDMIDVETVTTLIVMIVIIVIAMIVIIVSDVDKTM